MSETTLEGPVVGMSDAAPAAVEEEPKEKAQPRGYAVLRREVAASPGSPVKFEMLREVQAHSAEQAVREVAKILFAAGEEPPITLVAVTAKSFKPTTINPKPRDPQLILS